MEIILIIASTFAVILLLAWIGLHIQPASFAPFPLKTSPLQTIPLPGGLPAPVEHFYRKIYGERIPLIHTAIMSGKVSVRPFGLIAFPGRFRITHIAGQGYRHYIEAGIFGIPLFKVNERHLDGRSLFESPFGTTDNDPKVNQGANLGLWSESVWLPAIFLTDERVRWEPLDEVTALLSVPSEGAREHFVVRFDPETGLIAWFESMRFQGAESKQKILWLNKSVRWDTIAGQTILKVGAAIWMNDGKPWAIFTVEDVVYNADVKEYIQAKGP